EPGVVDLWHGIGVEQNRAVGIGMNVYVHRFGSCRPRHFTSHSLASMSPAPDSLCILRTSAIGDVTHVVPLVRTLQKVRPDIELTWIVGKLERKLVGDIAGVRFVTFDKGAGLAGMRAVRRELAGQHFDALLHMQVALRSNLLSLAVHARRRVGYDRARSKDLHGLFINERIAAHPGQHVLDALGSFLEPLDLQQTDVRWDIPVPDEARAWAREKIPDDTPTLVVSPSS